MEIKIWEQRTKKRWGLEKLEQKTGISHYIITKWGNVHQE